MTDAELEKHSVNLWKNRKTIWVREWRERAKRDR
jgi:hypothetical protein